MHRSNSSQRAQLAALRSHRKLQNEKRHGCRQQRQKPFPNPSQRPRSTVHVIAPSECEVIMRAWYRRINYVRGNEPDSFRVSAFATGASLGSP
jgi:hypothetical protein